MSYIAAQGKKVPCITCGIHQRTLKNLESHYKEEHPELFELNHNEENSEESMQRDTVAMTKDTRSNSLFNAKVTKSESDDLDLPDNLLRPFPIEALGIQDIEGENIHNKIEDKSFQPFSEIMDRGIQNSEMGEEAKSSIAGRGRDSQQNSKLRTPTNLTIQRRILHTRKSDKYRSKHLQCNIPVVERDDLYMCCHTGFQAEYLRAHLVKYHNITVKSKQSGVKSLTFRCQDCNNIYINKLELIKHIEMRQTNKEACKSTLRQSRNTEGENCVTAVERHWCFEYGTLPEGTSFSFHDPQLWLECPICLQAGNKCYVDTVFHMNCHLIQEHQSIIGRPS